MKTLLILFLFASCGQHRQPATLDTMDSDNDGVMNALEQGLDKYIAINSPEAEVRGKLFFDVGKDFKQSKTFEITTETDWNEISKNLLAENENKGQYWVYTSAYSVLNIQLPLLLDLNEDNYEITLNVSADETKYSRILYVEQRSITYLENFKSFQKIRLDRRQLAALLNGEARLALEKYEVHSDSQILNNKTYKVIMNNGRETKKLTVSNLYSLKSLMNQFNISNPATLNEDEVFFNSTSLMKKWWLKDKGDYKLLVFANELEIYHAMLKNFKKTSFSIKRINGKGTELSIGKAPYAKIIFRLQAFKTINIFQLNEKLININPGSMPVPCVHYIRNFTTTPAPINISSLKDEISLVADNLIINNQAKTDIVKNEEESILELKLNYMSQDIKLMIEDLPLSTFELTGVYKNSCRQTNSKILTNYEGSLTLIVEAFVEKI